MVSVECIYMCFPRLVTNAIFLFRVHLDKILLPPFPFNAFILFFCFSSSLTSDLSLLCWTLCSNSGEVFPLFLSFTFTEAALLSDRCTNSELFCFYSMFFLHCWLITTTVNQGGFALRGQRFACNACVSQTSAYSVHACIYAPTCSDGPSDVVLARSRAEGQDVCITQRWSHKGESCAALKKQVDAFTFLFLTHFYSLVKWLLMKDSTPRPAVRPSSRVLCHQFRLVCGHWTKNLRRTSWSSAVYLKLKPNSRLFHSKDACIVNVYLKSQTKLKTYHVQIPVMHSLSLVFFSIYLLFSESSK